MHTLYEEQAVICVAQAVAMVRASVKPDNSRRKRSLLINAYTNLVKGFRWANTTGNNRHKAQILRMMNWVRAEIKKVSK